MVVGADFSVKLEPQAEQKYPITITTRTTITTTNKMHLLCMIDMISEQLPHSDIC